jgi:hypothetical protein
MVVNGSLREPRRNPAVRTAHGGSGSDGPGREIAVMNGTAAIDRATALRHFREPGRGRGMNV